jgi:hypothetical protein
VNLYRSLKKQIVNLRGQSIWHVRELVNVYRVLVLKRNHESPSSIRGTIFRLILKNLVYSIQKNLNGLHELILWLRIEKVTCYCEDSDDISGP